jgi:hypothetical protein
VTAVAARTAAPVKAGETVLPSRITVARSAARPAYSAVAAATAAAGISRARAASLVRAAIHNRDET